MLRCVAARAKKNSCYFEEVSEERNQHISFVCKAKATYIVIAAPPLVALGQLRWGWFCRFGCA